MTLTFMTPWQNCCSCGHLINHEHEIGQLIVLKVRKKDSVIYSFTVTGLLLDLRQILWYLISKAKRFLRWIENNDLKRPQSSRVRNDCFLICKESELCEYFSWSHMTTLVSSISFVTQCSWKPRYEGFSPQISKKRISPSCFWLHSQIPFICLYFLYVRHTSTHAWNHLISAVTGTLIARKYVHFSFLAWPSPAFLLLSFLKCLYMHMVFHFSFTCQEPCWET